MMVGSAMCASDGQCGVVRSDGGDEVRLQQVSGGAIRPGYADGLVGRTHSRNSITACECMFRTYPVPPNSHAHVVDRFAEFVEATGRCLDVTTGNRIGDESDTRITSGDVVIGFIVPTLIPHARTHRVTELSPHTRAQDVTRSPLVLGNM